MKNVLIFKLTGLLLMATLVFSISPASADKNKLERVVGVITANGGTPFPPNPQFALTHDNTGIYLIGIEERFTCILMEDGEVQAAKGSRLATPGNNGINHYTVSPLVWVNSDVPGVCNDVSLYQFSSRRRSDNSLVNGTFSFQIIGSRVKE
jgi:hypothetical protein